MATFDNKVVIITGCSSGIGLATTLLFLDRHAKVFGIDVSPFKHEITEAQQSAFGFHQTDLTAPKASEEAVAACIAKYGPKIDVLVNCAGITDAWSSADTLKDSEWERVMMINLTVPVRLMTAVLPSMKEHKAGAIVNVCSKAGSAGAAAGIAYTTSKHGLVCFGEFIVTLVAFPGRPLCRDSYINQVGATKNAAWRFHTENIRCNAVLPGGMFLNFENPAHFSTWDIWT